MIKERVPPLTDRAVAHLRKPGDRIVQIPQDGHSIRLRKMVVQSPEQASELKFLGSPTAQVNGLDIDPAARDNPNYGLM